MSNTEKIKELVAELKTCPETDIHKYFNPVFDMLPLLPLNDQASIGADFYNWAKENEGTQPFKLPYGQCMLGLAGYFTEQYELALPLLNDARLLFEEASNPDCMALCDTISGGIYRTLGNVDLALKALWEAYAQLDRSGNFSHSALASSFQIASIYVEQGNYQEAEPLLLKTLASAEQLNNAIFITNSLQVLGKLYMLLKKYKDAREVLERSLSNAKPTHSTLFITKPLTELANYYFETGDYSESLKLHTQALTLREQNNILGGAITNLITIAAIHIKLNKLGEAIATLNKGLELADKIKVKPKIYQLHQKLSEVYETTKEFDKSLYHYKTFYKIKEQVEVEDSAKKVKNLQLIFEAERTRKENAIIKKQKGELEDKNKVIEEKNRDIIDSITYAKRLQDAILPPISLITKYLPESFVLFKPKDIVAGDFYWVAPLPPEGGISASFVNPPLEWNPEAILIAAADCTGHGVPGALVSVVCSNALNRTVKEFKITEPGKILDKTRELVLETFEKSESNVQDGMDISLAAISRQPSVDSVEIHWSGAFNSLWYIQEGEMKELPADKQPIGKTDNPKQFATHRIKLHRGDILYLFTDGYADQFGGEKGKKFKYKQLQQLIMDNCQLTMQEQKNLLEQTLESWKGSLEQVDDILIIGIRI
ncbi:MAG: tetratricopeptide repeat protein [Bacteroidia bacterium]